MAIVDTISQYWSRIQGNLFPQLEEQLGELTGKERDLISNLELIRIEKFAKYSCSLYGRPPKERAAIGQGFYCQSHIQYADDTRVVGPSGI